MSTKKYSHRYLSGYCLFNELCRGWFYVPGIPGPLIESNDYADIYSISKCGLEVVDSTTVQGTRFIKNLKVTVSNRVFNDSADHAWQAIVYVVRDGIGIKPFSQIQLKEQFSTEAAEEFVQPFFSVIPSTPDAYNTVACVNLSDNINKYPVTITVPGTIKLNSGDKVAIIFRNIEPIGHFYTPDETHINWRVDNQQMNLRFMFTSEYDISF